MKPPPPKTSDKSFPKKKFWFCAIWISIVLIVIPPVFGLLGTVVGMWRAFDTLEKSGMGDPGELADDISFAITTTAAGLALSLIGVGFFVLAIVRYLKLTKAFQSQR